MPCLPIVARELRVAARRRGTYRVRFWAVLLMGIVFAWNVLGSEQMRLAAGAGQLLHNMAFFAFLYALFIGAVSTSDTISAERRGGTLGFLFLTDLKGYDVIAGKLAASSLNALYALIAILPILGVPLLIGGVTLEQVLRLALALLTIIVLRFPSAFWFRL
jgi:ABC-type transport system involved in cytochrome c biogenesis permease component